MRQSKLFIKTQKETPKDEIAKNAHEREIYSYAGLLPDTFVLNSGVMVIDCDRWVSSGITERCIALGEQYKARVVGDQTLINLAIRGEFKQLPWRFNTPLRPKNEAPASLKNRILHFIGSPKPWSISGLFLHKHREVWSSEARRFQFGGGLQ